ncbi:MAG: hypothetical protein GY702_24515 [Desulfobulbaceae bacterium]|nr:hypothetical protein [Desulfobulbaceae bacterium]
MSEKLYCQVVPVRSLQSHILREMFSLFCTYFTGADVQNFLDDISAKDRVFLFRDTHKQNIQGFSTLRIFEHRFQRQVATIVYTGDTIIHKPYRNSLVFAKNWIGTVFKLTRGATQPVYWFLLSSGFRTYRCFPVYFKQFYPAYNEATPPSISQLMHDVSKHLFGGQFNPETGIVRFDKGNTPLIHGERNPSLSRLNDPHINFFMEHNPGHEQGDELVCLAEVSPSNFSKAGKRVAQ